MENVPLVDLREGGPPAHARRRRAQALALRDACLGWLPCGGLLARLADPLARGWLRRVGIAPSGKSTPLPGPWAGRASGCCTAPMPSAARRLADEAADGPVLRRTLDWPFPGPGQAGRGDPPAAAPAGDFLNVTWPGFAGVLTAVAPGRFAASINQAPMRRRTAGGLAAVARLCAERPGGLFRQRPSAARACPRRAPSRPARRSTRPAGLLSADAGRAACPFPRRRLCAPASVC